MGVIPNRLPLTVGPFRSFRKLTAGYDQPGGKVTQAYVEVPVQDTGAAVDQRVTQAYVEVPVQDTGSAIDQRVTNVYVEVPLYLPNDPESLGSGASKRPVHIFRPYDLPTWPRYRRPGAYDEASRPSSAPQTLTPDLFTNVNTFYSPTISYATPNLLAPLFVNPNSFYPPLITVDKDLAPGLLTNTSIFYSPRLHIGLVPGLLVNTNTFYSPTVRSINAPLHPGLLVNLQSFFPPTVRTEFIFPEEPRIFKRRHYNIARLRIPPNRHNAFYGSRI